MFTRAGIFDYFEHVHHYFGCPEDDSAWPTLTISHRPDIDQSILNACMHQRYSHGLAQYAIPHFNLKDLTTSKSTTHFSECSCSTFNK
jgi:hypothetical protein